MTDLYCDIEVAGRLSFDVLSVAVVSASGREFYAENGGWEGLADVDAFARENVLPQFGRIANATAADAGEVAERLMTFLSSERPPFTVHFEQAGAYHGLQALLSMRPGGAAVLAQMKGRDASRRAASAMGSLAAARSYTLDPLQRLRKDHALADARALKAKCTVEDSMQVTASSASDREVARLFLSDRGTDDKGRMLSQMLAWDDATLATAAKDSIQWMFPLTERSPHNPGAPAPTFEDFAALAQDDSVRAGVTRAAARLLGFMGLEFDGVELKKAPNWSARCGTWAAWETPADRYVSRMLRCACLLGFRPSATRLVQGLESIVREYRGPRANRVIAFWRGAIRT